MAEQPLHKPHGVFLDVLSHKSFRFLWIAQICSQLSANMMLFLLALIVYRNTASNTAVSGLFLAHGIPALLFGMLAGTIVDKLDRRRVLIVCDLLRAVLVLGLFFFSWHLPLVYALVFLNALITQFYVPAEAPMIPRIVPSHLLMTANSLFSFTYYSSMAMGFILAGPLLRLLGNQWSLLFLVGLYTLAAYSVSHIRSHAEETIGIRYILRTDLWRLVLKVIDDLKNGLAYIRSSPVLLDGLLLLTGTQITIAMLGTLGPGFADRVLEIDVRDVSLVIVGPAVLGIILGALWVGNIGFKIKPKKLIRTGILSAGTLLMLVSLTVRLRSIAGFSWLFQNSVIVPLEIVLFFLLGFANSLLDVPANSSLQKEAEGEMRGRVYGMLGAAIGGVGIVPIVIGGILADTFGVGKVILLMGFVIFGYGIWRVRYNTDT